VGAGSLDLAAGTTLDLRPITFNFPTYAEAEKHRNAAVEMAEAAADIAVL